MKDNNSNVIKNVTTDLFWLFLLQGLSFIGMGILIFYYPQIIVGLVIGGFLWLGLTTIVTGWKIKRFGQAMEMII